MNTKREKSFFECRAFGQGKPISVFQGWIPDRQKAGRHGSAGHGVSVGDIWGTRNGHKVRSGQH